MTLPHFCRTYLNTSFRLMPPPLLFWASLTSPVQASVSQGSSSTRLTYVLNLNGRVRTAKGGGKHEGGGGARQTAVRFDPCRPQNVKKRYYKPLYSCGGKTNRTIVGLKPAQLHHSTLHTHGQGTSWGRGGVVPSSVV